MGVPGKRRRGRPKRRSLGNTRNVLSERELSAGKAQDRVKSAKGCRRRRMRRRRSCVGSAQTILTKTRTKHTNIRGLPRIYVILCHRCRSQKMHWMNRWLGHCQARLYKKKKSAIQCIWKVSIIWNWLGTWMDFPQYCTLYRAKRSIQSSFVDFHGFMSKCHRMSGWHNAMNLLCLGLR